MKDIITKIDNTAPPSGNLTAAEFNDFIGELENTITLSGQTLDKPVNILRQLIKSIAVGGERVPRTNGQTAQIGEIVLPDNTTSAVTINLPPFSDLFTNAPVYFEQIVDQPFSTNNLTVGRNGQTIMGLAEDMTVSIDDLKFKIFWTGTTWQVAKTETVGTTL